MGDSWAELVPMPGSFQSAFGKGTTRKLHASWGRAGPEGPEITHASGNINFLELFSHPNIDYFLHQIFGAGAEIHREPTQNGG